MYVSTVALTFTLGTTQRVSRDTLNRVVENNMENITVFVPQQIQQQVNYYTPQNIYISNCYHNLWGNMSCHRLSDHNFRGTTCWITTSWASTCVAGHKKPHIVLASHWEPYKMLEPIMKNTHFSIQKIYCITSLRI